MIEKWERWKKIVSNVIHFIVLLFSRWLSLTLQSLFFAISLLCLCIFFNRLPSWSPHTLPFSIISIDIQSFYSFIWSVDSQSIIEQAKHSHKNIFDRTEWHFSSHVACIVQPEKKIKRMLNKESSFSHTSDEKIKWHFYGDTKSE